MNLRPGDIGFVHNPKSFVGRAIAWFMGSRWSHSFLIIQQLHDGDWTTLETSSFEVTMGYLSRYKEMDCEIWRLNGEGADEARENAFATMRARYGETYGYLQLLSFAVVTLAARIGIRLPNFFRQGVVCTGVVLDAKSRGTVPGFSGLDPESLHTEHLWQLVQLNGSRVTPFF